MKLGFNLLLWTTHVTAEHGPIFEALKEAGYDGVEVPLGAGDEAHYRALAAELDRCGLERTAITSVTEETNPTSSDPAIRTAAVEHLRWATDMAAVLGSSMLGGPFHSAYKYFTGMPATEDERAHSAEVLRAAAEYAQSAGVQLSIEALNRFECYLVNTMADARDLVQRADHPALGVHYDTHHMHIEEKSIRRAVLDSAAEISHVHLSENDRGVPGKGQVAWAETFQALHAIGYDGWLTLEAFSRNDPEFAGAIHVWRDYAPAEEIYREGARFVREGWLG